MRLHARQLGLVLTLACVLGVSPESVAQVPGAMLKDGAFDIGIAVRFIDRDLESDGYAQSYDYGLHVTSAFLKFGVNDWFTWSGEVAVANTHALEEPLNENNWDARYYLVGMGAQVAFVGGKRWRAVAGLHVSRTRFISRDGTYCHERGTEWLATVHAERRFTLASNEVAIWGGPSVGSQHNEWDAGLACFRDSEWDSVDDWGAVAGVDALWYSRVNTFVHVVYAQHFQPRIGLALRFE